MQTASAPTVAGHSNGKYGRDAAAAAAAAVARRVGRRRDISTRLIEANLIIELLLRDLCGGRIEWDGCFATCKRRELWVRYRRGRSRYPRFPLMNDVLDYTVFGHIRL